MRHPSHHSASDLWIKSQKLTKPTEETLVLIAICTDSPNSAQNVFKRSQFKHLTKKSKEQFLTRVQALSRQKKSHSEIFWQDTLVRKTLWTIPEHILNDILNRIDKNIRTALVATRKGER